MNYIGKIFFSSLTVFVLSCSTQIIKTNPSNLDDILSKFQNPTSEKILVVAHRAVHTKYPENSLAAFQHSIDSGVDIIETDIRTSKDGRLVLMHDDSIDRTTNGKGKLRDYTFEELQIFKLSDKYGVGDIFRVPLAEDAFNIARAKIMLDLDIKDVSIKKLVNLVHKTRLEKQVLFYDSDFAVLDSVLLLDSTLIVMPQAHSLEEVKEIITKYHPKVIHIDPSFYSEEVVSLIKKSGARIWINALGKTDMEAFSRSSSAYDSLIDGGANIFQTDLPLILKTYLKENKLK